MKYPFINIKMSMPLADVQEMYTGGQQAKKGPGGQGETSGAGGDADTQGRGPRRWRLREVSAPWTPLRASEDFERALWEKLQRLEKNFSGRQRLCADDGKSLFCM
jgi:hypothetical protein